MSKNLKHQRTVISLVGIAVFLSGFNAANIDSGTYVVPDTGQTGCYSTVGASPCPKPGSALYGQDAQYEGPGPSYTDNGDGTVTDNITGLMWERRFRQIEFDKAETDARICNIGGYTDWRVPTVKELYSLINFDGNQGSSMPTSPIPPSDAKPFIDTTFFDFEYPSVGRYIDAQYVTGTLYVSTTMNGNRTFFGVNFADGRIKGYPTRGNMSNSKFYARYVRGNPGYGINNFVNNNDGTITDRTTGLTWMQVDSGDSNVRSNVSETIKKDGSLNWPEALAFCEDLTYAGKDDWKLPNAKELHSIIDYTRSPDTTDSPAIDPIFKTTPIKGESKEKDYPFFWTSTSFLPGRDAVHFSFGDERFHPDNIILNSRNADILFVISKKTGKIVWQIGPRYDESPQLKRLGWIIGPNHTHMIPKGLPGAGDIMVYDNGGSAGYGEPNPVTHFSYHRDYSRVVEFNPVTLEKVWEYSPQALGYIMQYSMKEYSPYVSSAQRLVNGDTLITEGALGRVIEVTPDLKVVWEWVSPYYKISPEGGPPGAPRQRVPNAQVYRAYRVPYEYIPRLTKPKEEAVIPPENENFKVSGSGKDFKIVVQ
jgi:hypothetical protein